MPHFRLGSRRAPADDVVDLTEGSDEDFAAGPVIDLTAEPIVDLSAEPVEVGEPDGPAAAFEARPLHVDSRVSRALGILTLSRHFPVELRPVAAVVAATAWALAAVLAGCLASTLVIGLIAGNGPFSTGLFIATWRVAHLMPVATADGPVSLLPMLPAVLVWLLLLRACAWLAARLDGYGRPWPGVGLASLAGGYFLVAALIATSPTSVSQAGPLTAGWAVLLLLSGSAPAVIWLLRTVRPGFPRVWLLLRACATAVLTVLTAAFLVLMLQLLLHWPAFQDMTGQLLDSGSEPATRLDAAALGAVQLAYLPNATIWAASYLLGAGFVVGHETIVSPFSVTVGTLPDLPLVALLPTSPFPWPWLPPLLVAWMSIVAGAMIRSAGLTHRLRTRVVVGLVVALVCASAMALLAGLASGGLGPGRLDHVGPVPPVTFVAAFLVFGFGQLLWAIFPSLVDDLGPVFGPLHARASRLRRPRLRRSARVPSHGAGGDRADEGAGGSSMDG